MLQNKKDGNNFPNTATENSNGFQQNSTVGMNNMFSFSTMAQPAMPFATGFSNVPQLGVALQQNQDSSRAFHDPAPGFSFAMNASSTNPISTNNAFNNSMAPAFSQVFQSDNCFTNNTTPENNATSSPHVTNNNIFSSSSDLTESELSLFQANTFSFGNVPLKPPPKELCH